MKLTTDQAAVISEAVRQYWPELGGQAGFVDRQNRIEKIIERIKASK